MTSNNFKVLELYCNLKRIIESAQVVLWPWTVPSISIFLFSLLLTLCCNMFPESRPCKILYEIKSYMTLNKFKVIELYCDLKKFIESDRVALWARTITSISICLSSSLLTACCNMFPESRPWDILCEQVARIRFTTTQPDFKNTLLFKLS